MRRLLEAHARQVLGECSVLAEHSRAGEARLLEVADRCGTRWFVKCVERPGEWRAEVRAYRRWVPVLGDLAPRLRAADPRLQTMVLSAVPGDHAPDHDLALHRQAGALLRRFHGAREPQPATARFAERWSQRLDGWLTRSQEQLTAAEVTFAREQTQRLRGLPPPSLVPCHGDFRPHNWLRDDSGVVRVVDFGGARLQPWALDLMRLYLGPWWEHPELAAAFLDGYGYELTDQDRTFIRSASATQTVVDLGWGIVNDRPVAVERARERLQLMMTGHPVTEALAEGRRPDIPAGLRRPWTAAVRSLRRRRTNPCS